jgi:putative endonuclease
MNPYYYTNVLRSQIDRHFYTGYTSNLLDRLDEHNAGKVASTKNRCPLELVYWEGCLHRQDVTKREKYLETAWGKRYIKNRLKTISRFTP